MKQSQCMLPKRTPVPCFDLYFKGWWPEPTACLICMGPRSPVTCIGRGRGGGGGRGRGARSEALRVKGKTLDLRKQAVWAAAGCHQALGRGGCWASAPRLAMGLSTRDSGQCWAIPGLLRFSQTQTCAFCGMHWLSPTLFQCESSATCQDGPGTHGQVPLPKEFWL